MVPRRLAFIAVLILWLVNGALLAWVHLSPPPPPPPVRVILTIFCEKPDQAKKISKVLGGKYQLKVIPNETWKHQVQDGFIVFNHVSEENRQNLYQSMKHSLPVKIVGEDIRLGPIYRTRKEADKVQKLQQSKGFVFQVRENIVDRVNKVSAVHVGPLEGSAKVGEVKDQLKSLKLKDDQFEERSFSNVSQDP